MLLMMIGNGPQMILSVSGPKMAKAKDAATILYHIIDNKPDVDVKKEGIKLDRSSFKGDIVFKGVNFNYPTRPDLKILQNFDVHIEAGKTTALVGPSGSGKSTVIQMIERFYNPMSGSITVDGV
jgi:ATP-binding cassette subfamily B (MDR/TAP) protein 1